MMRITQTYYVFLSRRCAAYNDFSVEYLKSSAVKMKSDVYTAKSRISSIIYFLFFKCTFAKSAAVLLHKTNRTLSLNTLTILKGWFISYDIIIILFKSFIHEYWIIKKYASDYVLLTRTDDLHVIEKEKAKQGSNSIIYVTTIYKDKQMCELMFLTTDSSINIHTCAHRYFLFVYNVDFSWWFVIGNCVTCIYAYKTLLNKRHIMIPFILMKLRRIHYS